MRATGFDNVDGGATDLAGVEGVGEGVFPCAPPPFAHQGCGHRGVE